MPFKNCQIRPFEDRAIKRPVFLMFPVFECLVFLSPLYCYTVRIQILDTQIPDLYQSGFKVLNYTTFVKKFDYSNHWNFGLVRYSNGQMLSGLQMVRQSNGIIAILMQYHLKSGLEFKWFNHLNTGNLKVWYSDESGILVFDHRT